ncbi:type I secretion system permease/ATPase [Candidatus Trichorickettsia mobilis]|uniref:type I secretion system permease/ATPase n=1 Tax=Candidatus Trichorickettsia mobilis TaxID=1346319 RepID=UPI00292D697B|nr:type I secretion system permease/ATPase [Candidatus Trichorickettsia mobilis]
MQNNPIDVDVLDKNLNLFTRAIKKCKDVFWITFWFAFVINLLMLITPLYSLQVLDRVIGSGSLHTLLMLSVIIGIVYFVYGLLQIARSFTLIKVGEWLDNNLSPALFGHAISASATRVPINASQLLRDFQTVKTFLTSTGINTLFDAPWSIIYIIVIFLIHPYLGILTIVGALLIVSTAFFNAIATNKTLGEATEFSIKSLTQAEVASRNAEAVEAMGMMKNVTKNWQKFNQASLSKQSMASYRNGVISNFSRFIRNIMQMLVTGIGAYVVVDTAGRDMTTGGMIMSSIIVGRALAPFDNAIELWKSISGAMKSYKNINHALNSYTSRDESMPIPHVEGHLTVENVYYALPTPPGAMQPPTPQYILKGVSFSVQPGEILAIIGPSAAGKSTLAKVIVGVWKAASGAVRLDNGEIFRWNREDFGKHVGYLPQGIELFSGSIKQNIARMLEDAEPEKVIAAAKLAGAHEMILRFPDGYDSDIGQAGSNLSGGQRQRIGLARAFYDTPKLVILDEPNANLDEAGEIALSNALKQAKAMNTAVIVISHRPSVLSVVDKILVVQDGAVAAYGSQDEIQNRVKMLKSGTIHINDK